MTEQTTRRLGLLIFGGAFLILFIGFAIAEGLGNPSIPSGAVAVVEDTPGDIGTVSQDELDRAIEQAAASGKVVPVPKPGDDKYEELKEAALGEVFDPIWIQGQAEEMGISVTPEEVTKELEKLKDQAFKTPKQYEAFLKGSKYTEDDVLARVKLQVLSTRIQEQISEEAPEATEAEIANYYDAVKDTQFTTAESRDARIVVNKDKAKTEEALSELEKSHSPKDWEDVAAKFSEDPNTSDTGGLQRGLTRELLKNHEELMDAVFDNPIGVVVGPIEVQGKFFVLAVDKIHHEKVQAMKEVSAQIAAQLKEQAAQASLSEFISDYQSKWESRTFCADGFVVERCSNYRGDGHPQNAPTACYEADPKGGRATECPAPVAQTQPALPGSVTIVAPQGEQLAQRPHPTGIDPASEEGTLPSPLGS